jgi:hypothetical protein
VARYLVLGRTAYPEPLELQGALEAGDDRAAAAAALDRFGDRWVELVLLPEPAVHWVIGPPPEGSGEPQGGAPEHRDREGGGG